MTSLYVLETIEAEGTESKKYSFQSDITIGRGKDADVFIDLKSLSRKHARIEIDENRQCKLINLSKTNPSVVNGNIVQEELILTHNDMLNIGMSRFHFRRADNPTVVENPNVPMKLDEKNQIEGKRPSFLAQLNQRFATRGTLPGPANDEKVTSNLQRKVSGDMVKGAAAVMSTPLLDAIKSRRKSIGNKLPLTEIIAKPSSIKVNNAPKSQNLGEMSSLKLRTAFSTTLQAALQAKRVETAGRTPQKINSSVENSSSVALSHNPSTPQGHHSIVHQGQTSKPVVAIRKVLSTPLRQAIQTSSIVGRKGPTEIVADTNAKADIGRPSKGMTDSMRKAIHARRSSYRPTPVKKQSSNTIRIASPEHEVVITDANISSSCARDAPVDMDALTAANTKSNQLLLSVDMSAPLPTEQLMAVSSESTPPQSVRKTQTVANSVSKNTTHISWCSRTPTSASNKLQRSALKTAIAPQRLSNIPAFIDDGDDNGKAANSGEKEPEAISAVETTTTTTTAVESNIPTLETNDTYTNISSAVDTDVQDNVVDSTSVNNIQREAATRLKKLKSSHSTLDLRRKKSKSPQYKYAYKPSTKKGYCDKVVAVMGKSNRLFGGMSLKLPKNKLRQILQAPSAPDSSFSNDYKNTIDTFYPSTTEMESDGQVAEGDYIQNMLVSKPILAEDAVQALAIEICAHSFANELTKEGISDDAAFESAMDSVTTDVAVFSRRNSLRSDTPTRDNIDHSNSSNTVAFTPTHSNKETVLQSLQKKATLTAIVPDATADSDFVALLTDAELQLLDVYAEKLSLYGLSLEEAHAVALDAYIAGIEKYFSTLESATQYRTQLASDMDETACADVDVTPQNDISFVVPSSTGSAQNDSSMEKDQASTSDNSYSLREFFQLPPVYLDANDDSLDTELVENYAKELQQVAYVDAAIAYGIALDSFLADPVTFRHRIGKLPLPRPLPVAVMQSVSDNDEHLDSNVNESADYDRNDNFSVQAERLESDKSLIEKEQVLVPSNRHIYFSIDEEDDVAVRNPLVESVEAHIEQASVVVEASEPENSDAADLTDEANISPDTFSQPIENLGDVISNTFDHLESASSVAVMKVVEITNCQSVDSAKEPSEDMHSILDSTVSAETNVAEVPPSSKLNEDSAPTVSDAKPSSNTRKRGAKKVEANLPAKAEPVAAEVVSVPRASRKRLADEAISAPLVTEAPIVVVEPETKIESSSTGSNTIPTPLVSGGDGVQRKKQTRRGKAIVEAESSITSSNSSATIAVQEENKALVAAAEDSKKPIPMKQRSCSRKRGEASLDTTKTSPAADIITTVEAVAVATTVESVRVTRKRVAESATSNVGKTSSASKKPRASSRGRKAAAAVLEDEEDMEEAVVIICDKCDKEFFVDELGISDIPEGDWFCISCISATVATAAAKSRSKSVVRQRQQPLSASPSEQQQQQQQRTTRSSRRV